ncbi:MAG: hypothetical protein HY023_01745, partial [Chloroflexi bacterium]|nr:hypothetical protein [Chloroflexota bacterium]
MTSDRVRVLLTVPHLCRSASPYREMIAIASHCSRAGFCLTVCGLRDAGWEETKPLLDRLSVGCFVAPFRPRGHSFFDFVESVAGQRIIASHGPFEIQHSLDFTSSPFEALMARAAGRCFVFSQRNLNDQGHTASLRLKIRLSHRVVAIAAHMAGFLRDLGTPPAKIVEIFNGIDLDD